MALRFRFDKDIPNRTKTQPVATCEYHQKRLYTSRKIARQAMKRFYGKDSALSAYECEVNKSLWHFGHLTKKRQGK